MKSWQAAKTKRYRGFLHRSLPVMALVVISVGCAPKSFQRRSLVDLMKDSRDDLAPVKLFRAKDGRMTAQFPDENDKLQRLNLEGMNLVFAAPRGLYISASYVNRPALRIGSNDKRYWLAILLPDARQLQWGLWKYADQQCNSFRMGANRLIEALGQVNLRELAGKFLGPVLQTRPPYHVLMYMAVDEPGNWYYAKEIFLRYEKDRLSVSRIVYYDPEEQPEMEIVLGDYRKITAGGQIGYVPGTIELKMERHRSYMKLTLGRIDVPDDVPAFNFPSLDAYDTVKRVDEQCVR